MSLPNALSKCYIQVSHNIHCLIIVAFTLCDLEALNRVQKRMLMTKPLNNSICGILRGCFKVPLYSVFAIQAQDMTSQVLYLRYNACDVIVYVRSQTLYLRYSAYDVIVYVRSQTLYLRYSACGIILETKVTFMMESKTGFEISTKVTCQS